MAYTTIDDPSAFFQTTLYTGNGTAIGSGGLTVTNGGNSDLKPDLIWHKKRGNAESHAVADSNRGTHKGIFPNETNAESTGGSQYVNSFNTDGFTVGNVGWANDSGQTYVAWQWKCNGGTTSSNTDGGITSTVQVNSTAGFSIVTWTGNGSQTNIGHGLGTTPEMIWIKNRSDNENWWVGCSAAGTIADGKHLNLNLNSALQTNNTSFVNANPTSTVFDVGGSSSADNLINGSSDNMLAYCFHSVQGYSKIGSYVGNGANDGPFVYLGFKPAWLLIKISSGHNESWHIWDNKRVLLGGNPNQAALSPNTTGADTENSTPYNIDFLSNGFKIREDHDITNGNGDNYVYMAFAEHPFVGSKGAPTTAE